MTHEPDSAVPAAGQTDEEPAYRLVDQLNHGWLNHSDTDTYWCFQPARPTERLGDLTVPEIVEKYGAVRPVQSCTAEERAELHAAFDLAGRKTIGCVASALDVVFNEARDRSVDVFASLVQPAPKPETPEQAVELVGAAIGVAAESVTWMSDYDYAVNTLTAGRPGSWEADLLHKQILWFGNDLNLHAKKGTVQERRAAGPHPKRVDVAARDRIADVLRAWTNSPDRYTEVAETLAHIVAWYADEKYGADGWKKIADQWLQPGGLAQNTFSDCYRMFYGTSQHFDTSLI